MIDGVVLVKMVVVKVVVVVVVMGARDRSKCAKI